MKPGYSKKTILANINEAIRGGSDRNPAIRQAFDHARKSYFHAHPQGLLPVYLAFPKTARKKTDYTVTGAPMLAARNPVRELDIAPEERERIQQDVGTLLSGRGKRVRQGGKLFSDFTGYDDPNVSKISVDEWPKEMVYIGQVDFIGYTTERDGKVEAYRHDFKAASRPLFCTTPDGKRLFMLGGAFRFTERGIVDHKP
jgi:hypothetical protein